MIKSEELFVLIKSLTRNEKRYFRVFVSREGGNNIYLRLFDAIDGQKAYNENAIRQKFKGEKFLKQLHVPKNYLRGLILKSLRNFHAGISKDAEVKDILRNIEILFNKELHQHALVELKRAEKIAADYELVLLMVDIQDWKRRIQQHLRPQNYEAFREILDEQNEALDKLKNLNAYNNLIVDVSHEITGGVAGIIPNKQWLADIKNTRTLEARVMHVNARYFQMVSEGRAKEGEQLLYDLIDHMESLPHRIAENPGLYVSTINNFITYFVFSKRPTEALELIQRAKAVFESWNLKSENRTILKQVARTYNIELEVYRDAGMLDEKASAITDVTGFVEQYAQKMPKEYVISFWFQLAYISFSKKDYKEALNWVNKILQFMDRTVRPDIQVQCRMLNLMIHFELGNMFVLRYFVDSAKRFIKKMKGLDDHEKLLLSFFSKISKVPVADYKELFQKLNVELIEKASSDSPIFQQDYIDYRNWIEQRI